jgi:hypothetical protein
MLNVEVQHGFSDDCKAMLPFPTLTLLILQHNKSPIKVSDPEAHLIATAIGVGGASHFGDYNGRANYPYILQDQSYIKTGAGSSFGGEACDTDGCLAPQGTSP